MANPNPKNKAAWDMASNYAELHGYDSPRESFHDDNFIMIWNNYVDYIKTGKLPRGARKRDIEAALGRPFSKDASKKSKSTIFGKTQQFKISWKG